MRHNKHRHVLGVKTAHRSALLANLASSLIFHNRIETTLSKAKALRPFIERIITLAKKAHLSDDAALGVHYRRQALAKLRSKEAVRILFNEKAEEFADRNGGYTRIYKIGKRIGDAADMAIIELIEAGDEGYTKPKAKKSSKKSPAKASAAKEPENKVEAEEVVTEVVEEAVVEEAPVEEKAEAKAPKKKAPAKKATPKKAEAKKEAAPKKAAKEDTKED